MINFSIFGNKSSWILIKNLKIYLLINESKNIKITKVCKVACMLWN